MFNIFKKREQLIEHLFKHEAIKITPRDTGSHGDHWRALYGVDMNEPNLLRTIVEVLLEQPAWRDEEWSMHVKDINPFTIDVLAVRRQIFSSFPVLHRGERVRFATGAIIPWTHSKSMEAQMAGTIESFGGGINFFASDYLQNKVAYHENKNIEICLSAFAYTMYPSTTKDEKFVDNFVGYMYTNSDKMEDSYSFIGEVVSIEKIVAEDISGYLVETGLVRGDEGDGLLFTIPIFVHESNMRAEKLDKGDRVEGVFWLQGRF